jgi:hypothetical protein
MITILVDEGYAYDYLAILTVKNKKINNEKTAKARNECHKFLINQVGEDKHLDILKSKAFTDLFDVNSETFDAVEKARYGEISAKEVDDLNMKRYHHKVALQNQFFPHIETTEFKS